MSLTGLYIRSRGDDRRNCLSIRHADSCANRLRRQSPRVCTTLVLLRYNFNLFSVSRLWVMSKEAHYTCRLQPVSNSRKFEIEYCITLYKAKRYCKLNRPIDSQDAVSNQF